jgi:quercetin dioxygenase-like cupin family protein
MSTEAALTSWSDIPAEILNPLITRQFVSGSQAMLARIALKKGCLVPLHAHPNEQISFIVEGALLFLLGDATAPDEKIVRAGEILLIPANLPHSAEALEDTIDLDIFSPPRQDWIDGSDNYLR